MAIDTIVEVLYDGDVMISVGLEEFIVHRVVVDKMRVNGHKIDVGNTLKSRIKDLEQKAETGMVNPYRTALDSIEAIRKEIPVSELRGMNLKDVSNVVAAIIRIAARSIQ
jgi:hypothetical protein